MTDGCGSPTGLESFAHFAPQSPTFDFSFLSSHDDLKDHHVPAIFSANFPDNMLSLGLTGDAHMDDLLSTEDQNTPRKRDRGERIVWTPEEDEYLRAAVQLYGDKTEKWAKIAACVPGRTNKNCRKRWFHSLDPSLKKGAWTEEEDELLRTGVEKFKGQWSKIAERIQGRTDDQCAKRWRESLDPEIDRAAWTPQDDVVLLQKFEEFGSQWQKIALSFPGRPGLHCRNRWRKIQRSLNHMQRASKRRRNQLDNKQGQHDAHTPDSNVGSPSEEASTMLSEGAGTSSPSDDVPPRDPIMDEDFDVLEDSGDSGNTDPDKDESKDDSSHEEEKPYGCAIPDCNFESSSPSLLFYHFKASHHGTTVLKPFRCTMPGCEERKRYKNINGLQYHITHAKNTPGRSGHTGHGNTQQEGQQTTSSSSTMSSDPVSASEVTVGSFVGPFVNPSSTTLSGPFPTPAEIQSLFPPPITPPLVTHQAFNIPHTPERPDESALSGSPMALDISHPLPAHSQSLTPLLCPELGCGQSFHVISILNAHMANHHGRQSLTMTSNDTAFVTDSISIPENGFDDVDMDMAYLASESASPMDITTVNSILHQDEAQLRSHFDNLTRDHGALSLGDTATNSDNTSTAHSAAQELEMLSMNELLFAHHVSDALNDCGTSAGSFNNRIHFGSHINISANDPSLTAMASTPTPSTSANASPRIGAMGFNHPQPLISMMGSTAGKAVVLKKFPCTVLDCPKSYGSNTALKAHIRHDHSGLNHTRAIKPAIAKGPPPASILDRAETTTKGATTAVRSSAGLAATGARSLSIMPGATILPAPAQGEVRTQAVKQKQNKKSDDPSDKPYKCLVPGCGKGYTNINGLKSHLLQAHGSTPSKGT
ncbi:hypothetical protein KVV02_003748 [Mortierella alpina]|uniref:Uncharacterized protein n=1 Tax=Mortierella alpina TaxID=64518 RepID=A0A9P8A503_MORAP|nr:hypothetical protein KVV02_003748 [Mortierella alpina]